MCCSWNEREAQDVTPRSGSCLLHHSERRELPTDRRELLVRVAETPGGYALVEDDVRRALVRRFPYGVFFVDDDDSIAVIAVFHLAMSPSRLDARARERR
jgi:hypothetical protein